ncbi:hypothetical protein B0H13DRAFT_1880777 [Mycena leptocephala]|nr:hypothetical protein B0H13DRAFT_1880777 [Mycena leptocephala]
MTRLNLKEPTPETTGRRPATPQLGSDSDTNTAPQPDMDIITNENNSSVFALIIGIDKTTLPPYEARREQCGLGVPKSNILFLKDEDATRDKILAAFESHLLTNARIPNHGDASMILFFAGHGTRVNAPGNLMSQDEMVEGICPVDERTSAGGKYVHTIPDYVLVHLLGDLYEKKGQNITVIFDSCHSGGMGRNVGQARAANSDSSAVPPELDSHLWTNKSPRPHQDDRLWSSSATTHVWLATCAANESAREIVFDEPGQRQLVRGRFTKSLIEHLRKVDLENTTYMELLDHLPAWSGQTPFCSGDRRNRLLFDKKFPRTGQSAISLTAGDDDIAHGRTWRVSMGAPAGVVPGTEFSILDRDNHTVCTLVAQTVKITETVLILKDGASLDVIIPESVRAMVSDWKNNEMIMHVYVPEGFPHIAVLFPTRRLHLQQGFVQTTSRQDAQIALRIPEDDDNSVVVERFTSTIFDAPLNGVSLELYRLMGNFPTRQPDRRFGQNGNLVIDNQALFKSEYGAKYGIVIHNASPYDLFPYLFAFDPTDYTIGCLYSPHSTRDPPLPCVKGEVTIGMGGQRALDFTLPRAMKKSSAFLKLFVTTKAIDIDWIQLEISPFHADFQGMDVTRRLKNIT